MILQFPVARSAAALGAVLPGRKLWSETEARVGIEQMQGLRAAQQNLPPHLSLGEGNQLVT